MAPEIGRKRQEEAVEGILLFKAQQAAPTSLSLAKDKQIMRNGTCMSTGKFMWKHFMIFFNDRDQEGTTVSFWMDPFNNKNFLDPCGMLTILIHN